ncbi:hydrolase / lipoprotein [Pontimonas salivibrio]|uniref:Hydrolase / lipoprotein n=1 Tax=Pontimonas salivibrio TaxID=1159327 RepID=A0A2L2BR58_9MICO|nr:alpha/beta fold hydrolase [Pontimonas salivibrio]AVG24149.1 hydrolase / lipoprotein [Pontimonas salivibrio]
MPLKPLSAMGALLPVVLVVSACQGPATPLAGNADATTPVDIDSYYDQEISWGECDAEWLIEPDVAASGFVDADVTCATVAVPAVYEDVSEAVPDFEIAMMRREATERSMGAIFINPGGPGVSGVGQVQFSDFPEDLTDNFDIIGFDPRGVQYSGFADGTDIRCSDVTDFITYFEEGSPANEEELDAVVEVLDVHYETCQEDNPYWWTLSTNNVVADLDIMREVVTPGEPLNFIGSSYGTTIAGRYVSTFPDHVGKIVFDSPTTVDTDRIASRLEKLAADEEKLAGLVQGYADNQEISFDEAWDTVLELRQLADDDQLYGFAGIEPAGEFEDTQISSESLFTRGIAALNYLPEEDAQAYFNQAIFDAVQYRWNGTFEWFAFWLDGYEPDSLYGESLEEKEIARSNEFEIRVIVNTMDFSQPPLGEDEQREFSRKAEEVAPMLTALYSDASGYEYFGPPKGLSWYQLAIDNPEIPDPPTEPFVPSNPSGEDLLIIGSLYESVTPFSFAEDTAETLGATLISVESEIHAPAGNYTNDCVNRILVDYFLDRGEMAPVTCPGQS